MQIPPWLANLTGANGMQLERTGGFADGASGGPTMADAARGIGHDMMQHFRAGQQGPAGNPLAQPGAASAPGMIAPPAAPVAPIAAPMAAPSAPAAANFGTQGGGGMPPDLSSILQSVGHGVAPHIPSGVPLDKIAIHFKN